ncbi:MAG: hypothetical protein Kow0031_40410 [Anaerolineae bacterium]
MSTSLTQKDTHFFDRTTAYDLMASHRSAAFIERQDSLFVRPFRLLLPAEQAFALGYLCHLCVDEVSKAMWQRPTWLAFAELGAGPAFAALDEFAKSQLRNYPAVVAAIEAVSLPRLMPAVPSGDWQLYYDGVLNFVRAETTEQEFLALVDMFDRPPPARRERQLREFRANINAARERVGVFNLHKMVSASVSRTMQRIQALLAGRAVAPGLPDIP